MPKITGTVISFSTDDYAPPQQSDLPLYPSYLQVIKDGTFINSIHLREKQFHLIGRLEDLCDIFIDNPTVSRKHAILQYKSEDPFPYLYDLGCTHGTEVNRKKLPARVYQKIRPFDTIKFGISSRLYIYRCPELEAKLQEQQQEHVQQIKKSEFMDVLSERSSNLSSQQLKDRYLEMLENDPIYNNQRQIFSRKLQGNDGPSNSQVCGADWGITDENEVYGYKNDSEYPIEVDVIRRLPGLDQNQLNRLSEYEINLRKYEEIELQLNELANKERREYGLEEKGRDRKQKLEKKFVEALETLEKSEEWVRVHVFGEQSHKADGKAERLKEIDTFGDDEFMDRTLLDKNGSQSSEQQVKSYSENMFTTQDYWKLEKEYRRLLRQLILLEQQESLAQQQQQQNGKAANSQQLPEEDDLDLFMKQNNLNLNTQNCAKLSDRKQSLLETLTPIRSSLIAILGELGARKIEQQERGTDNSHLTQESRQHQLAAQNKQKLDRTLQRLEKIQQEKEEEVDEEDARIFEQYRPERSPESQPDARRLRESQPEAQMKEYERPMYPRLKVSRDKGESQEYEDLTKKFG